MWRYRELMPLFDGEEPVTLGEGFTPLIHARAARRGARPRRGSSSRTNRSTRPTRSRRAACRPRSRARSTSARRRLSVPIGGQRRQRDGRLCGGRRARGEGLHAEGRRSVPFIRRMRALRRRRHARRRADHRRRTHRRGDGRAARLVRRLHAEGAVPHRRQEDDGVRARRADGLDSCRTGSSIRPAAAPAWSACGRRSTRWSASAGRRRAGGRRWCRSRPSTARRSCARSSRARERRELWENARTIADGLRVPKAIGDFLVLRAVRESGGTALAVSDADMVGGMREIGKHEGISAAPEGGAALVAIEGLVKRGVDWTRRIGGAVQHRRRAEIP